MRWSRGHYWEMVRKYLADKRIPVILGMVGLMPIIRCLIRACASINLHCQICGAEFKWYWRWRHYCYYCGKCVCIDCMSKSHPKSKNVCKQCFDEMIVVRSGHVGGHTTIKILRDIETDFEYDDFDDAKSELMCKTLEAGGNAILNYKYHRHKYSKPTNGGTYYYSRFSATGTAAIVKERAYGGDRRVF